MTYPDHDTAGNSQIPVEPRVPDSSAVALYTYLQAAWPRLPGAWLYLDIQMHTHTHILQYMFFCLLNLFIRWHRWKKNAGHEICLSWMPEQVHPCLPAFCDQIWICFICTFLWLRIKQPCAHSFRVSIQIWQFSQRSVNSYPQTGAVRVGSDDGEAVAWFVQASHSKGNDGGVVPSHKVLWGKNDVAINHDRTKSLIKYRPFFPHFLYVLLNEKWFTRRVNVWCDTSAWSWHTTHPPASSWYFQVSD